MFGRWWRPRSQVEPLSDAVFSELRSRSPVLSNLNPPQTLRLQALAGKFLVRKSITPVHGLELDALDRALIATLCCLPVLELGGQWLAGWHEVVVYPGAFRVRRSALDEPTGVLHEWDEDLAGEAWSEGPLILSWEDLLLDQAQPGDGCSIVVHEIAHKLDLQDGILDGTPPLPPERHAAWVRDFQAAYDALQLQLETEAEPAIDPYAATAPEEFFAVVSEYHFSAPQLLREAMPAVAAHLEAFYGPSPAPGQAWLQPGAG